MKVSGEIIQYIVDSINRNHYMMWFKGSLPHFDEMKTEG